MAGPSSPFGRCSASSLAATTHDADGDASSSDGLNSLICTEDSFSDLDQDIGHDEPRGSADGEAFLGGMCGPAMPMQPSLEFDADATSVSTLLWVDLRAQTQGPAQAATRAHPQDRHREQDRGHAPAVSPAGHGAAAAVAATAAPCAAASLPPPPPPPPRRLPGPHRCALACWMRAAAAARGLQLGTWAGAVELLDGFVAAAREREVPPASLLQLLGLACLSLAAKYHEGWRLPLRSWTNLAADEAGRRLYQPCDLSRMELVVARTLRWRLGGPTAPTFLTHFAACMREGAVGSAAAAAANFGAAAQPSPDSLRWPHAGGNSAAAAAGGGGAAAAAAAALHDDRAKTRNAAAAATPPCAPVRLSNLISTAAALAELSLSYDDLLPYAHSTVALACVDLAERLLAAAAAVTVRHKADAAGGAAPPACAAAEVIAARAGLPLSVLAPGLEPCRWALSRAYCWAVAERRWEQPAI